MGMDTRPVSLLPTHHDGLPPRFGRASEIGTTVAVGGIVIEPVQRMVSEPRHDILLYPFAQPVVYRTGMRNLQQSGEKRRRIRRIRATGRPDSRLTYPYSSSASAFSIVSETKIKVPSENDNSTNAYRTSRFTPIRRPPAKLPQVPEKRKRDRNVSGPA